MATTTALLSTDEYLKTEYRPDCDFVDGEIEERNSGEFDHGTLQVAIGAWFLSHQKTWNIRVISELVTERLAIPSTPIHLDLPTLLAALD